MTSARNPGARRWSASVTIAISAAALCAAPPAAAGGTAGAIDRLIAAVAAYAPEAATGAELRRRCGADALCAARLVAAALDGRAVLERIEHPDTDTIRWVDTRPSVRRAPGRAADGVAPVALDRFGRKAWRELRAALDGLDGAHVVLDLRANRGGDLDRMLGVAGLFTGAVANALRVIGGDGARWRAIPARRRIEGIARLTVVVGPETASSGEILAALLRRHGGAEIVGERTRGKDYVVRAIPVHHDWRLLLPAERIEIPGESLAGGVRPDRPASGSAWR